MIEKTKLFAENLPYFTEKVVILHAITPIIKNDMPEQITPLSTLYLLLHGAGTAISVVLCLYLLLCRGKAIAPDITPPARLRRWAAALFAVMALAHVWWMLFYTYSDDTSSVIYGLLVAIDCITLPPVFVGTLLTMLQDRRRPLWPIFVVMTPCAVMAVLQTALPSIDLTTPNKVYGLILIVAFIIYMVVAVRQYGRWVRDNYADLEHKEVWVSLTLLIGLMLLLMCYEYTDDYVMNTIAHIIGFPLAGLLLWRVDDNSVSPSAQRDNCLSECSAMPPCKAQNPSPEGDASHIGQLLAKHCEDAQLFLKTDLTPSHPPLRSPLPRACRCTEAHRRPAAGPGERLPQLQHLQLRLQATHAQERHRLDTRRGIDIYILNTIHQEIRGCAYFDTPSCCCFSGL